MQIHQIKRKTENKKRMLVGRGGKRGKTSGRGTKGQKARAGHKIRPEMRDFIKKLPKLRGYSFNSIQEKPTILNLDMIEKSYSTGEIVSPTTLKEKGLISNRKGKIPQVKILGNGEITKKLTIQSVTFSQSVKNKIEKAGGKISE